MEKDKHMCKFCSKSFPCGRSLGGHMRSHLINISSPDHPKTGPKKKLPPLVKTDLSMDGGDQFGSKAVEEDTLLQEKACKECGKSFQSWKALFGHMKCHSVNGRMTSNVEEEDSCNDDHNKLIMDSQSDNEAATPFCRRKRSKRYTNFSPSVSEIDEQQQEQEEQVALSLIILSRDKGDWGAVESSDNSCELLQAKKLKKLRNVKQLQLKSLSVPTRKCKNLIKESNSRKRKSELEAKTSKFTCSICKKAFPSYQALGGHRASHKKFKGCCFPTSENSLETENSHNQSENLISEIPNKEHECPICFKVFSSGQALGGHKRSHLIGDQGKNNRPVRGFLDLNLPAPEEEWWSQKQHQLLGLLSSS